MPGRCSAGGGAETRYAIELGSDDDDEVDDDDVAAAAAADDDDVDVVDVDEDGDVERPPSDQPPPS